MLDVQLVDGYFLEVTGRKWTLCNCRLFIIIKCVKCVCRAENLKLCLGSAVNNRSS